MKEAVSAFKDVLSKASGKGTQPIPSLSSGICDTKAATGSSLGEGNGEDKQLR